MPNPTYPRWNDQIDTKNPKDNYFLPHFAIYMVWIVWIVEQLYVFIVLVNFLIALIN